MVAGACSPWEPSRSQRHPFDLEVVMSRKAGRGKGPHICRSTEPPGALSAAAPSCSNRNGSITLALLGPMDRARPHTVACDVGGFRGRPRTRLDRPVHLAMRNGKGHARVGTSPLLSALDILLGRKKLGKGAHRPAGRPSWNRGTREGTVSRPGVPRSRARGGDPLPTRTA